MGSCDSTFNWYLLLKLFLEGESKNNWQNETKSVAISDEKYEVQVLPCATLFKVHNVQDHPNRRASMKQVGAHMWNVVIAILAQTEFPAVLPHFLFPFYHS